MADGSVAVGLAGGAAKGLGNLGALKALEEFDLRPTAIAGTSAGALVGGLYAAGKSVSELEALLSGLSQREVRKLIDLTWTRGSLVAGKKVEEFLYDLVGDVRIEELDMPFIATSVDIRSGTGYYLNRGRLIDAIRASISVPGVFEPVAANGGYLVDGGVRLNLPLEVLHQFRPDLLIGINITPRYSGSRAWKTAEIQRDENLVGGNVSLWERIREFTMMNDGSTSREATGTASGAGETDKDAGKSAGIDRASKDFAGSLAGATGSGKRDSDSDRDAANENEAPGTAYLLSRVFEFVMYEASQAEIERAAHDFVVDVDMEPIEVWEFWKGAEAVELGYRQTVEGIERFRNRDQFKGWWKTRARRWARRV